jgi:hypothetical protein
MIFVLKGFESTLCRIPQERESSEQESPAIPMRSYFFHHSLLKDLRQVFADKECAMRRRISSILLVEFLVIACALQLVHAQAPPQSSERQVPQKRGVPITSRLHPGETRLTIVSARRDPPLLVEPPPGMSRIAWVTRGADVVMIARVESRLSKLTPAEDWIDTSVQIKILRVLKSKGRRSFSVGEDVSFIEQGGSLEFAGRHIDAIVTWASRFEVGKEFLIFADINSNNELVVGFSSAYEIVPGGSLRGLLKTRRSDSISESSLNSILLEIEHSADAVDEK